MTSNAGTSRRHPSRLTEQEYAFLMPFMLKALAVGFTVGLAAGLGYAYWYING